MFDPIFEEPTRTGSEPIEVPRSVGRHAAPRRRKQNAPLRPRERHRVKPHQHVGSTTAIKNNKANAGERTSFTAT
jgi:hypothetical protein